MNETTLSLKDEWNKLKEENPRIRSRQAAEELGVSEGELLASVCDGKSVVRLDGPWNTVIEQLETLGYVMALTRNDSVVSEKRGIYQNIEFNSHVGLALGDNIDLRIFLKHWKFGFAAPVENPRGILHSLQFFNKQGEAVHKVYMMNEEHLPEYEQLVDNFRHEDQSAHIQTREKRAPEKTSLQDVDLDAFLEEWSGLKDTHDFYSLINKRKLNRAQAFTLGEKKFTRPVSVSSARQVLDEASESELPIMIFVGSGGVIQIHSGPVHKIKSMGDWLNVLDPEFNLHLREDHIAKAWVVQKPTNDGIVTSLEIFDEEDKLIANFFGARKPGNPELDAWRELTAKLS